MRAFVVHPSFVQSTGRDPALALAEAVSLVEALGLEIAQAFEVPLQEPRAATLFGSGKVSEIGKQVAEATVGLVVVDAPLTAGQQRNLETEWKCKVLDRTGLILEIFGDRAKTREGVLQVELAHLSFQKSRLVRSWTHLERQRGGFGFLGGPGETQIEADKRALDTRIQRLRLALDRVVRTRGEHRKSRHRVPYPVIALVGYTNAGKSTLFNQLTGAAVGAKDMLFATLDPTMRALQLPSGPKAIASDTVGFISDLPTQLVAAFRATLEEVTSADLLVHVRDISHPETEHQATNVRGILQDLGIDEMDLEDGLEVWNKVDLLPEDRYREVVAAAERRSNVVPVSAHTGVGIEVLLQEIVGCLNKSAFEDKVCVAFDDGRRRAWLFEHNLVRQERTTDTGLEFRVEWTEREKRQFDAL
ncbi:MAG: GTPase HflX [Pseudomonadota bacterium]